MTQEEELLLFKELCARLSYGLKVNFISIDRISTVIGVVISYRHPEVELDYGPILLLKHIKPYLRPMSSMTKEEKEEYNGLLYRICDFTQDASSPAPVIELTTFFYSHHLDCCGLIEKELALEAPEGMYELYDS